MTESSKNPHTSKPRDPSMRVSSIRNLIKQNPDTVLTLKDFNEATKMTKAITFVHRLMEEGYIDRKKVTDGMKGHRYSYTWNDIPKPLTKHFSLQEIQEKASTWQIMNSNLGDEATVALKQLGVNQFIQWLESQPNKQIKKGKIKEHGGNS